MKTGKWILFALFLYLQACLYADGEEIQNEGYRAELLFESHHAQQALLVYQHLLTTPIKDWQRALILYNIGTVQLSQGTIEKALETFQSIPFQSVASPLLARYIDSNTAFAYLSLAQDHLNQEELFNPYYLLYQISKALEHLSQASQIECFLQHQDEQKEPCTFPSDLDLLYNKALALKSQVKALHYAQLSKELTPKALASLLQEGLSSLQGQLSRFQIDHLFLAANSLNSIWDRLAASPSSDPDQPTIASAYEEFQKGLKSLQDKKKKEAEAFFKNSYDKLSSISLEDQSALFWFEGQKWLLEAMLKKTNLDYLQKIWDNLQSQISEEGRSIIEENLSRSMKAVQQDKQAEAHLFLAQALFQFQTEQQQPEGPQEYLAYLIFQAQRLLTLLSFYGQTMQESPFAEQSRAVIAKQQTKLNDESSLFIQSAIQFQKEHFAKERGSCQRSPWNQVIPLFDQGYQIEQAVQQGFVKTTIITNLLPYQEQVINYWIQAFKAFDTPFESHDNFEEGPSQGNQENTDLFQLIQEMELQDQDKKTPAQLDQENQTW